MKNKCVAHQHVSITESFLMNYSKESRELLCADLLNRSESSFARATSSLHALGNRATNLLTHTDGLLFENERKYGLLCCGMPHVDLKKVFGASTHAALFITKRTSVRWLQFF